MVREKTVITILVSTVLEVDGQEIMERVLESKRVEFSSFKSAVRELITSIKNSLENTFRFL